MFPIGRAGAGSWRAGMGGVFLGIVAGLVLPVFFWKAQTAEVFQSWFQVLSRDISAPHLKLGLASVLPPSWRIFAAPLGAAFFLLVLARIAIRNQQSRREANVHPAERPVLESLLLVGALVFSHMTEPPTLALLAPAVVWISAQGRPVHQGGVLLLLVLLPSDVVPVAIKNPLGGQYAIKTYALLWCLAVLALEALKPSGLRTAARVGGGA